MDITIDYKSTGMLIDEYHTNLIKIEELGNSEELIQRENDLLLAIDKRIPQEAVIEEVNKLEDELHITLKGCWDEQEKVLQHTAVIKTFDDTGYIKIEEISHIIECAKAAIAAQRYNAQRNKLIRQIDEYLGELDISPTIKSYSEE